MNIPFSLSVLDFQHPGSAVALVCAAEEWGYKRYWLGEHHSAFQCANPLLLGALLAGTTSRIRIGSGGVSLQYQSALRVAEDARLIEFMMPNRFDLGLTRGLTAPGPLTEALLDGRVVPADCNYEDKLRLVHGLVSGRLERSHPLAKAQPYLESGPPLWILGLSLGSARVAGCLGAGFCYSIHHSGPETDGPAILKRYRESFVPSPEFPRPEAIVVVRFVCAATEAAARTMENDILGPPVPSNGTVLGTPVQCASRIRDIASCFSTSEIMLVDFVQSDQGARLEMYRLLARELGLPDSSAAA